MTFSTLHKIFINVIINNFHRSSKLILLPAFIYAAHHGSISLECMTSSDRMVQVFLNVWVCICVFESIMCWAWMV